jgi:hypothetical protein
LQRLISSYMLDLLARGGPFDGGLVAPT